MLDFHKHCSLGIKPILFSIGTLHITSYAFFLSLSLIIGFLTYFILAKQENKFDENSLFVLLAGLFGGILGSKLPIWIMNYKIIIKSFPNLMPFLSGRTITGGLIGGTISVIYIKKKLNIKDKKGNLFAPAIALSLSIGRLGCFFSGCCYGIKSNFILAMDLGDGVKRHPTQLYETIFMFFVFLFLLYKRKQSRPGYLFYLLMNIYFIFRFFEEFIRVNKHYFGFTLFQYISIAAIIFINLKHCIEKKTGENYV